jgi:hypothetical protein
LATLLASIAPGDRDQEEVMTSHRTIRTGLGLAAALALAASAPAGARLGQDLRTPDGRDASQPTVRLAGQDLRSPDTRYGGLPAAPAQHPAAPARVIDVSSEGFDWGDAAIGAGGVAGLVLVLAGAGAAVTRRRVTHSVTP